MDWFKFVIPAYEADTTHLSTVEHGAYFLLIKHYMRTRLPLPENDRALANICGLTVDAWTEMAPTIRAFFTSRAGKLHQKRCDTELDVQDKRSKQRTEHAKKAAKSRWDKTAQNLSIDDSGKTENSNLNKNNNLHAMGTKGACSEHAQAMPNDATGQDKTRQKKERKKERGKPENRSFRGIRFV